MESMKESNQQGNYLNVLEQLIKAIITKKILLILSKNPPLFEKCQNQIREFVGPVVIFLSKTQAPLLNQALQSALNNGGDPSSCDAILKIVEESSPDIRKMIESCENNGSSL
ncbi:hypothetical protein IPN35_06270 [Candidatus Peregrinibacteria bacterium]|nr:MAG: hypothetical protein IPN35_06270 [Candidatus Peregrinibacteria bacterium]